MEDTWWKKSEELDPTQQKIVSLPKGGNHLIVGPPGSGKTNLLLLRASFLWRSGVKNIAILSFNRILREFIASGSAFYPFHADLVQTYRSWAVDLIRANGAQVDTTGRFPKVRENINQALRDLSASTHGDSMLDCVLLDEAQDYTIDEIKLITQFGHQIFAVGDNRQRIYESDGALSHLVTVCGAAKELKHHYRNGPAICRLADGIMDEIGTGLETTSNYDDVAYPSTVARHAGLTLAQQVSLAVPTLQTQLIAYPEAMIGVLCPRVADVRAVYELLAHTPVGERVQLQLFDEGYEAMDSERPILCSTIHGAKGLEFRAVHLLGLDGLRGIPNHSKLAYTAVTRAKTSLSLYHQRPTLPGYLERGIEAAEDALPNEPTLDELFGDGGS